MYENFVKMEIRYYFVLTLLEFQQDLSSPIRRKRHVGDSLSEQKKTDENSVGNSRASGNVPLLTLNNNQDTRRDEEWTRIMEMGTDSGKRPPLIRR